MTLSSVAIRPADTTGRASTSSISAGRLEFFRRFLSRRSIWPLASASRSSSFSPTDGGLGKGVEDGQQPGGSDRAFAPIRAERCAARHSGKTDASRPCRAP